MQSPKRKKVLSRYAFTDDGRVIIDVAARRIEDLYSNFDKAAPYLRKDLDSELAEYITDCAREIRRTPFLIRITLDVPPLDEPIARIRRSIPTFFSYIQELKRREMRAMLRRSLILLGIGIGILAVVVWTSGLFGDTERMIPQIITEGMTVAAWVSLWNALATFLVEWRPNMLESRLAGRLAHTEVKLETKSPPPA